jgi:hypothetical protein
LAFQQLRADNDDIWRRVDAQLNALALYREDMNGDRAIEDNRFPGFPA